MPDYYDMPYYDVQDVYSDSFELAQRDEMNRDRGRRDCREEFQRGFREGYRQGFRQGFAQGRRDCFTRPRR